MRFLFGLLCSIAFGVCLCEVSDCLWDHSTNIFEYIVWGLGCLFCLFGAVIGLIEEKE